MGGYRSKTQTPGRSSITTRSPGSHRGRGRRKVLTRLGGVSTTTRQYDTNDPYYQDTIVDGSVGGARRKCPKWVRALNKVRAAVSKRKFLRPVWEKHFDENSGKPYYYNTVTKQSTWEQPLTFPQPRHPQATRNRKVLVSQTLRR